MRLVDRPAFRPQHCAAVPYIGQSAVAERWVDTGVEMPGFDNHVYLSETAVREASRLFGFPTDHEHAKLGAELSAALAALAAAYADLAQLQHYATAVRAIHAEQGELLPA